MTRKFKMVGVLMAVVAMFALTASAAKAQFTSANYPATVGGGLSKDFFDLFGSNVTCTEDTLVGTLKAASNTLLLTPVYDDCTAFGLPATVDFTTCSYLFYEDPDSLDIQCSNAGDSININVYENSSHSKIVCHMRIPAQSGKTGISYTNSGSNIILSGKLTGIIATQVRTSVFCPAGTSTSSGSYTIQAGGITLGGTNGAISVD